MKILLVEDHPESGRILQNLVECRGHEVVAIGSAEEAEVELANQSFRFLILDWRLARDRFPRGLVETVYAARAGECASARP
jgi:DNA-binding response OmpR family regulator